MNLDETQRQRVTAWVLQGAKLSEIQTRLAEEFGIKLTYMEVRFLVDDLKLTLKEPEPPKPAAPPAPKAESGTKPLGKEAASTAAGKVSVSLDQLTRPGAIVSGKAPLRRDGGQPGRKAGERSTPVEQANAIRGGLSSVATLWSHPEPGA